MKPVLRKKNGHYYAMVTYHENGITKTKWKALGLTTGASPKAIKERFDEVVPRLVELYADESENLFTRYLTKWLERRKGCVENSTWEGMYIYVTKHIIPYFEPLHLTLQDITPTHIEDYYVYKYAGGRCDGKKGGLSIESIIKHKSVLMTALDDAVIEELIQQNPARYVKLPAKRSSKRKRNFLTAPKAKEMLDLFVGTPLYAVVYLTLFYGLRRSEVLGLKWSSVDFINDKITLENVVVKNLTIEEKQTMKTSASYHTYPLLPNVREVLIQQKAWQAENREKFGEAYQESDFVCTWEDGRCFRPDTVMRSFQRVLKRNNFSPVLRFHDLRHSTASILYERNWDLKDTQMWLRHADIKVTGDIYTHIQRNFQKEVPDCLVNLFSPTPKKEGKILPTPPVETEEET